MDTFRRHFAIEDDAPFPSNFKYDNNPEDCFNGLLNFLYKAIDQSKSINVQNIPSVPTKTVTVVTVHPGVLSQVPHEIPTVSRRNSRNAKKKMYENVNAEVVPPKPPSPAITIPHWEDIVQQKLLLRIENIASFKVEQGFSRVPREDSFFDFGSPHLDLERMPRYSTHLPIHLCKESVSLSLYKNLQNGRAGEKRQRIPAIEQALAKPKSFNHTETPDVQPKKGAKPKNLQWDDTIITVDFHHSSPSASIVKKALPTYIKGPRLAASIEILGSQTLKQLQSRFFCENDLIYMTEIKHPRDSQKLNWYLLAEITDDQTFQSKSIVINNTAYVGDVTLTPNYGQVLKRWESKNGSQVEPYKIESLKTTKLQDVDFKLGHPYLYIHGRNCEHILMFKDVRYLHPSDPQISLAFPRFTYTGGFTTIPCRVNDAHVAMYVVKDSDRLPESLTPLCRHCCENFCYVRDEVGKEVPVGTFKLYPLIQVSTLLLNEFKISR